MNGKLVVIYTESWLSLEKITTYLASTMPFDNHFVLTKVLFIVPSLDYGSHRRQH